MPGRQNWGGFGRVDRGEKHTDESDGTGVSEKLHTVGKRHA